MCDKLFIKLTFLVIVFNGVLLLKNILISRPPHPKKFAGYENENSWRDEWKNRLEKASDSWTGQWLSQQVIIIRKSDNT